MMIHVAPRIGTDSRQLSTDRKLAGGRQRQGRFAIGLAWLACLATQSVSTAAERMFQPKDVATLRTVLEAEVSPEGKWIAYGLAVPRTPLQDSDGRAWVELHVVDQAGKSRPFVTGEVSVSQIRWTPDGSAITYLAKRSNDKATSLYRIPLDGGESRRLLSHETGITAYAFSRDGQRIAYLATPVVETTRQEVADKGFDQQIYEEDTPATRVWIARAEGQTEPQMLELPGSAAALDWHPDGHSLAVVLAKTPSVDDDYMARRVHLVDVDAGRIVESINNPGKLGQVAWSPNGQYLAMISAADIHDPHEGRLMLVKIASDGALVDLMPEYLAHVSAFAWMDDDTLIWLADEREATTLGKTTLTGQRTILSQTAAPIATSLSLADGGESAVSVSHAPTHPPEVYRWQLADATPTRLTHSNPDLDQLRFAEQESIRWTARDGLELGGVLVRPLNYVPGRRYPLIMVVHGGPESHVPNGWITSYANPGQLAAARGFAVFYPNYRGSTGRGVAFSKLGQADAAGKEFDDLIDGVDHLVAQGLVDRNRVGITGGSYGGYASAWGATYYSERYAASVMFVGISDNISKVGTTDIPEEMYLVHHLKRLWDDWSYFAERSPIHYVQRNRTPTLILHGKQDPRVHPSQSLELFRHLKTLGQAPVRLVLYEGEGHGNRKAAARFDYCLRLLQWMEHYLQGPGGDPPAYELDYEAALK